MASMVICDGVAGSSNQGYATCSTGWQVIDATQTQLLVSGGFDAEAFGIAFSGVLLLWVSGLAVGWIVSIIRKLHRG